MSHHFDDAPSDSSRKRLRVLLIAYGLFVVLTLLVSILVLAMPKFADWSVPHFGSPAIGLFYGGTLFFIAMKFLAWDSYPNARLRSAVGDLLLIIAVWGLLVTGFGWTGRDFNNPYLIVSLVQPIWTVGVPLTWYIAFRKFT